MSITLPQRGCRKAINQSALLPMRQSVRPSVCLWSMPFFLRNQLSKFTHKQT